MRKKPFLKKHYPINNRGFSLSELLVSILIVSLLSIMVATGVRTSIKSYREITDEANAEVLLSTCVTMLKTELTTASDISVPDETTIFYNRGGSRVGIYLDSNTIYAGNVGIRQEDGAEEILNEKTPFISQITATGTLYVSFDTVSYNDGAVTIKGLSVRRQGSDKPLSELNNPLVINVM